MVLCLLSCIVLSFDLASGPPAQMFRNGLLFLKPVLAGGCEGIRIALWISERDACMRVKR